MHHNPRRDSVKYNTDADYSLLASVQLRPYVFAGPASEGGVSRKGKFGLPEYQRMGAEGFDGTYYRSVIGDMLTKRRIKEQQEEDRRLVQNNRD